MKSLSLQPAFTDHAVATATLIASMCATLPSLKRQWLASGGLFETVLALNKMDLEDSSVDCRALASDVQKFEISSDIGIDSAMTSGESRPGNTIGVFSKENVCTQLREALLNVIVVLKGNQDCIINICCVDGADDCAASKLAKTDSVMSFCNDRRPTDASDSEADKTSNKPRAGRSRLFRKDAKGTALNEVGLRSWVIVDRVPQRTPLTNRLDATDATAFLCFAGSTTSPQCDEVFLPPALCEALSTKFSEAVGFGARSNFVLGIVSEEGCDTPFGKVSCDNAIETLQQSLEGLAAAHGLPPDCVLVCPLTADAAKPRGVLDDLVAATQAWVEGLRSTAKLFSGLSLSTQAAPVVATAPGAGLKAPAAKTVRHLAGSSAACAVPSPLAAAIPQGEPSRGFGLNKVAPRENGDA